MQIGFIGLGNLGRALARRLLSASEDLVIWNRTKSKFDSLDGLWADSPAKVAEACDIVILNLFDSDAVHSVLTMSNGLLAANCRAKLFIDTTTNHYDRVPEFYDICRKHGASYIEAPVIGSVTPALAGELTILVSGEEKSYKVARPLLEKLGKSIYYLKHPSLATRMKLINNMLLGTFMASISEAVCLAEAVGLERSLALDIFDHGAGNSSVLKAKKERLITNDYSPHFSVAAIYKDLKYLNQMATEMGSPSVTGPAIEKLFSQVSESGMQEADFCAVIDLLKNRIDKG